MKVYIFPKNSPWGVLQYPQKGNEYNHLVNFPDDVVSDNYPIGKNKHNFINKFLMNSNEDWLIELNKQPLQSTKITKVNENRWKFLINLDLYLINKPNIERVDVENADFAVLEEGGRYYFITLRYEGIEAVNKKSGNYLIKFKGETDIGFTYPEFFEFREGTENFIERSHLKRFDIDKNNLIPVIDNIIKEEPTIRVEPLVEQTEKIKNYYELKSMPGVDIREQIKERRLPNKFTNLINNIRFAVFYVKSESDGLLFGNWYNGNTGNATAIAGEEIAINNDSWGSTNKPLAASLPYITLIVPFVQNQHSYDVDFVYRMSNGKYAKIDFVKMYQLIGKRGGTTMEPKSIQIFNYIPDVFKLKFNLVNNIPEPTAPEEPTEFSDFSNWITLRFEYLRKHDEWLLNNKYQLEFDSDLLEFYFSGNSWTGETPEDTVQTQKLNKFGFFKLRTGIFDNNLTKTNPANEFKSLQTIKQLIYNNHLNLNPDYNGIEKLKYDKYESKLLSPQFLKYQLSEWTGEEKVFNFYNFYNSLTEDVRIKGNFNFSPEEYIMRYFPEKLNNIDKPFTSGYYLQILGNRELPITSIAYNEYINRNRESIANRKWYTTKTLQAGAAATALGVLTGIAGIPFGQGAAGAKIALGGVGAVIKGKKELDTITAQLNDLKLVPNEITTTSGTTKTELLNGEDEWGLFFKTTSLTNKDRKIVFEKLFKYGYTYNESGNLNNFVNSRYYFNYIKALDVFNTIKPRRTLSASIKQIISDTYSNGFTVWHVRDLDTFKGIINYQYENWEMEHLNNKNEVDYALELDEKSPLVWSDFSDTLTFANEYTAPLLNVNKIGTTGMTIVSEKVKGNKEVSSLVAPLQESNTVQTLSFIPYEYENQGSSVWVFGLVEGSTSDARKLKRFEPTITNDAEGGSAATIADFFSSNYDIADGGFTNLEGKSITGFYSKGKHPLRNGEVRISYSSLSSNNNILFKRSNGTSFLMIWADSNYYTNSSNGNTGYWWLKEL